MRVVASYCHVSFRIRAGGEERSPPTNSATAQVFAGTGSTSGQGSHSTPPVRSSVGAVPPAPDAPSPAWPPAPDPAAPPPATAPPASFPPAAPPPPAP